VDLEGYDALDDTRATVLSSDDELDADERPSSRYGPVHAASPSLKTLAGFVALWDGVRALVLLHGRTKAMQV
jgi:hypothetical protein